MKCYVLEQKFDSSTDWRHTCKNGFTQGYQSETLVSFIILDVLKFNVREFHIFVFSPLNTKDLLFHSIDELSKFVIRRADGFA